MKNLILNISLLFLLGTAFISCRDAKNIEPELIEDEVVADMDKNAPKPGESWKEEKFNSAFNRDFGDWDNNSDHHLNSEEFYTSTFASTDASGDYLISEKEWNKGHKKVFRDFAGEEDFSINDVNKDNQIDHKEWTQAFNNSTWFTTYDLNTDKRINSDEWKRGLFKDWDADKDGMLSNEEYEAYSQTTN